LQGATPFFTQVYCVPDIFYLPQIQDLPYFFNTIMLSLHGTWLCKNSDTSIIPIVSGNACFSGYGSGVLKFQVFGKKSPEIWGS
jgi:hypothetical protein